MPIPRIQREELNSSITKIQLAILPGIGQTDPFKINPRFPGKTK